MYLLIRNEIESDTVSVRTSWTTLRALNDYACTYVYRKKIELLHNSFSCKQVNVMMMSIDPMHPSAKGICSLLFPFLPFSGTYLKFSAIQ